MSDINQIESGNFRKSEIERFYLENEQIAFFAFSPIEKNSNNAPVVIIFKGEPSREIPEFQPTLRAFGRSDFNIPNDCLVFYAQPYAESENSTIVYIELELLKLFMKQLLQRDDIDRERILVVGVDEGVRCACRLAAAMPFCFNGLVISGRSPLPTAINFSNLYVYVYGGHSESDFKRHPLTVLSAELPGSYPHKLEPGRAKTLFLEEAVRRPRELCPSRVVYKADFPVTEATDLYFIAFEKEGLALGDLFIASYVGLNTFSVRTKVPQTFRLRLNPKVVDFSKPIIVKVNDETVFERIVDSEKSRARGIKRNDKKFYQTFPVEITIAPGDVWTLKL